MVKADVSCVDIKMKSGQQKNTAAGLIGTIVLLILFYILFLPPEDRAELLGEDIPRQENGDYEEHPEAISKSTIFSTNPGHIDYRALDSYEYNIPSFSIFHRKDSVILTQSNNLMVKNGWFDERKRNISFRVEEPDALENTMLTLTLGSKQGELKVNLNGQNIFHGPLYSANPEPIPLNNLKQGQNIIQFSVSGVGMKFWTTNVYLIENLKITSTKADDSRSSSKSTFYISPEQGEEIEKAILKFYPDCQPSNAGLLEVEMNGINIFRGVPDCGIKNSHTLSPTAIMIGKNRLDFKTDEGNYLIDQISVQTFLEDPVYPTYYFDMEESLFSVSYEDVPRCGEIDGVCPEKCGEDSDKDCCFEEYESPFWCDVPTDLIDDRCVGRVYEENCERCRSGYKDENGDIAEACEGRCGDDNDGYCPSGCNINYDKDCCFERSGEQYWCEDLPQAGVDFTCIDSVNQEICRYCPAGYEGEKSNPECDVDVGLEHESELKENVDIYLEMKFTESGKTKEAILYINGRETGFDTREETYKKNINDYVEAGRNSIRLVPRTELDIRELNIKKE